MFRVPLSWLRTVIPSAIVLAMCLGTNASAAPPPAEDAPEAGAAQSALRVAMTGNFLPLHGLRGGLRVGYEVDLAYALGKELGREIEFLDHSRLQGLTTVEAVQQGIADVALSGIMPTRERLRKVDFTAPYLVLSVRLAAPWGADPKAITDARGKRVALVDGPWAQEAKRKLRSARLTVVKSPEKAIELLDNGGVDLVAGEDVGLISASAGAGLTFLPIVLAQTPIAMAVPKGKAAPYDAALTKLTERREKLVKTWKLGDELLEAAPPPPRLAPESRIYIAICHGGVTTAIGVYDPAAAQLSSFKVLQGTGDRAPHPEESQELKDSSWFHVRPGSVRATRGAACRGELGFLLSTPATIASPPGKKRKAALWAQVATAPPLYFSAVPYETTGTCKQTGEDTSECGQQGFSVEMIGPLGDKSATLITGKLGD